MELHVMKNKKIYLLWSVLMYSSFSFAVEDDDIPEFVIPADADESGYGYGYDGYEGPEVYIEPTDDGYVNPGNGGGENPGNGGGENPGNGGGENPGNGGEAGSAQDAITSGLNAPFVNLQNTATNFRLKPIRVSHAKDLVFTGMNRILLENGKQTKQKRLENVLRAAQENGPIDIVKKEAGDTYRLWMIPYVGYFNNVGDNPSRAWTSGFAAGGQYNNDEYAYTLALFAGAHLGNSKSKLATRDEDKTTGPLFGGFASWGAWNGGRVDGFFVHTMTNHDRFQGISAPETRSKYKSTTDLLDLQTSHRIKLSDIWSVRFNIGHLSLYNNRDAYKEFAGRLRSIPTAKNQSHELFGGIGVRYNDEKTEWRLRITGVYEYGRKYKIKGSDLPVFLPGAITPSSFTGFVDSVKGTHYLKTYATLNNSTGFKTFLGAFTRLSHKSTSVTFTGKVEYRW